MNRWYVEMPYTQGKEPLKIYAKTLEDIQSKFPEAISITPCDDKSHLQYIEDIISRSELICSKVNEENNQITEMYYYYGSGFILCFKLYKWYDDDEYFDYCEYAIRNGGNLYVYIGWMVSDIKEAYDRYFHIVPHKDIGYTVTPKEVKKNKYKKWYNKDGEYGWIDDDGYFYFANKIEMPNKYNKAEYDQFKNNSKAVFVKYKCATFSDLYPTVHLKWFVDYSEFKEFKKEMTNKCPCYCQTPYFRIVKTGYTKKAPEDRKVIIRLPYLDIDKWLKCKSVYEVACMWEQNCIKEDKNNIFRGNIILWLEEIVKAYKEYSEKQEEKQEESFIDIKNLELGEPNVWNG